MYNHLLFYKITAKFALHCLLLFAFSQPIHAASNEDAENLISSFHSLLINNMQHANELGFQGRYNAISPFIEQSFDFPLIAKVILSRHWKNLSDEKKNLFIEKLTELTKTTYAARFNEFTDEIFVMIGTDELKKGRLLVKTEIQFKKEDTVSLNYLLHPMVNDWKIISVVANGVNDLSLKRAEYSVIMKEIGFEGLLNELDIKIKEHENM